MVGRNYGGYHRILKYSSFSKIQNGCLEYRDFLILPVSYDLTGIITSCVEILSKILDQIPCEIKQGLMYNRNTDYTRIPMI